MPQRVAALLLERGITVHTGPWTRTDGSDRFQRSPLRTRVDRILVEVMTTDLDPMYEILERVSGAVLLHGEEAATWPVLREAYRLGLDTRIGLEDTLRLSSGAPARDNADLVRVARELQPSHRRTVGRSKVQPPH